VSYHYPYIFVLLSVFFVFQSEGVIRYFAECLEFIFFFEPEDAIGDGTS
jgi:hypothetical protein